MYEIWLPIRDSIQEAQQADHVGGWGLIPSPTLLETTSRVQSQEQAQSRHRRVIIKIGFAPFPWKGFHKDFRIGIAQKEKQSLRFQRENSPSCSLLLRQRGEEVKGR